jgi:BirA family biotin operon repressor/biotin-[acetyl-CoA-carboxylase] ligase
MIQVFDSLESTQIKAQEYLSELLAAPSNCAGDKRSFTSLAKGVHGASFLAFEQSAGQGRQGKSFFSPPEGGVYFSAILDMQKLNLPNPGLLMTLASLSFSETLGELSGKDIRIKWPNDLYLNNKKIAGILAQMKSFGTESYAIIGIGINLFPSNDSSEYAQHTKEFRELEAKMGTLYSSRSDIECLVAKDYRLHIAEELLKSLLRDLGTDAGRSGSEMLKAYREKLMGLGKEAVIIEAGERYYAEILGIEADGSLVVRTMLGVEKRLYSGEVSLCL